MKTTKIMTACVVLLAFCSVAFAAEYWVVRESGKLIIVEQKPADPAVIVKGPFPSRADAEVIVSGPGASVEAIPVEPARPGVKTVPAPPAPHPAPPGR